MANIHKLQTGQTVYLARQKVSLSETIEAVTIRIVSSKYFQIDQAPRRKFDLETLIEQVNVGYPCIIFLSEKAFHDEHARRKLFYKIREKISHSNESSYTLGQLEEVARILGIT